MHANSWTLSTCTHSMPGESKIALPRMQIEPKTEPIASSSSSHLLISLRSGCRAFFCAYRRNSKCITQFQRCLIRLDLSDWTFIGTSTDFIYAKTHY